MAQLQAERVLISSAVCVCFPSLDGAIASLDLADSKMYFFGNSCEEGGRNSLFSCKHKSIHVLDKQRCELETNV